MYLNLAASWKDLAAQLREIDGLSDEEIETCRRMFHCGAFGFANAQTNIMRMHDHGEARTILLQALMTEAITVAGEIVEIAELADE